MLTKENWKEMDHFFGKNVLFSMKSLYKVTSSKDYNGRLERMILAMDDFIRTCSLL